MEALRQSIVFRPFNLLTHVFPFRKPFHVIFCRNVMIYFDRETRTELVRKFYDWLVPGGYLFVGHAETVDREMAPFLYVQPSVYRKPVDAAHTAVPAQVVPALSRRARECRAPRGRRCPRAAPCRGIR